jgi:hypothetical protein
MTIVVPEEREPENFRPRLRTCRIFWLALVLPWLLVMLAPDFIARWPGLPDPLVLPEMFFHAAYGAAIAVFALARFVRRRLSHASPGQPAEFSRYLAGLLVSLTLAEGLAWVALALWVLTREPRLFYTLQFISGIALWLHRPKAIEVRQCS